MKIKNIIITVKKQKQVLKEFATVFGKARKGEVIAPHQEISFENLEAVRKLLTTKRLELLRAIKLHTPQ